MAKFYSEDDRPTSSPKEQPLYSVYKSESEEQAINFCSPSLVWLRGKDFVCSYTHNIQFPMKVIWSMLLCLLTLPAFAQVKAGYTHASAHDSLLWSLDIVGDTEYLNYTRTSAPYWEGSYALTPNYQWSHMTWDTITRQWESQVMTYQYAAMHTTTGQYAVIFLTYVSYHDRIKKTRHTYLEGVRVFKLE